VAAAVWRGAAYYSCCFCLTIYGIPPPPPAQFIYYVAVSGVLYDIIRGVPPFGYDQRTRRVIFVAQQSGTQYGVEGLMVGGLNMFAAIAAILMVRVLPYLKSTEARNYIVAGAGLLFLFLYYHVYNLYNYKNPWYSLTGLIWG